MQIFRHIHSLREALAADRHAGKRIGFVPTMGNLHRGHLALVTTAKSQCDVAVASIFVNRLQFGLNEDWDQYPRTFDDDCQQLIDVGCDYLFFPEEREIYPNGMDGQTRVVVPSMTDMLCGASRPGHFEGVTTVVSKLLNIIQPDTAVFGLKDYQQIAVIRRMVGDLCIPVEIVAGDIVREHDGLAMSSRNHFITADERPRANQLNQTLNWIKLQLNAGQRDYLALEKEGREQMTAAGFRVDYLQICSSDTLTPAAQDDDKITVLGAMYTESARLIDNVSLLLSVDNGSNK
ncbi:MAG: pantoate--beta-alanine ligase [Candidatus Endobugula sp.]|jgi:pantoate--beta-alanine ligase